MTDTEGFVEEVILEHGAKTPEEVQAYNRAYYLRNRKLKGRTKRVEEDEVPMTSPSGAKLVDYDGKGAGKATYSDGSVYTGAGWKTGGKRNARSADEPDKIRNLERRAGAQMNKLSRAIVSAQKLPAGPAKQARLNRLNLLEGKIQKDVDTWRKRTRGEHGRLAEKSSRERTKRIRNR